MKICVCSFTTHTSSAITHTHQNTGKTGQNRANPESWQLLRAVVGTTNIQDLDEYTSPSSNISKFPSILIQIFWDRFVETDILRQIFWYRYRPFWYRPFYSKLIVKVPLCIYVKFGFQPYYSALCHYPDSDWSTETLFWWTFLSIYISQFHNYLYKVQE